MDVSILSNHFYGSNYLFVPLYDILLTCLCSMPEEHLLLLFQSEFSIYEHLIFIYIFGVGCQVPKQCNWNIGLY